MTDREMCEADVYSLINHLNCGYSGDNDPIHHGGVFYDTRDWKNYGYASCVEFWHDPENTDILIVQCGVINKSLDMEAAFACIGLDPSDSMDEEALMHAEIEASRSYNGIEPDGDDWPHLKSFNLNHWRKEWRIWRSVRQWLESLGN